MPHLHSNLAQITVANPRAWQLINTVAVVRDFVFSLAVMSHTFACKWWKSCGVFSERTTLRSLYAIGRPPVCLLSVCCLWRWCTLLRRLNFSAIFFHHTIALGLYFSGAKNRWWGTPLSPWNLRSKWPTPFKTAKFRQISAHSASTVIASEKSSISTYRKSITRFPTSHRWTVYVTPKSPKGWHKTRYHCLCQ